jgi:hypothetical protein
MFEKKYPVVRRINRVLPPYVTHTTTYDLVLITFFIIVPSLNRKYSANIVRHARGNNNKNDIIDYPY